MVDNKLAHEEAQRTTNYEAIKTEVKSEVGGEIAAVAEQPNRREAEQIENVGENMRQKAINEVVETENEVERGRIIARVSQVVDYVFYVIYSFMTIRLLLELFAARESAGFTKFVKSVTGIFYTPFSGIVPSPTIEGGFTLALPIIIAIVFYMFLHFLINSLLRIFVHRKTTVQ